LINTFLEPTIPFSCPSPCCCIRRCSAVDITANKDKRVPNGFAGLNVQLWSAMGFKWGYDMNVDSCKFHEHSKCRQLLPTESDWVDSKACSCTNGWTTGQ
jgi:hypothetical protein